MEAKELRIDNLVLDSTGNTHRVAGVYPNRDYSKWSGIPLNEEWLVKFGFIDPCENKYFFKDVDGFNFIIHINEKSTGISYFDEEDNEVFTYAIALKYVHQLQNLYFALTGQELTIKSEQ